MDLMVSEFLILGIYSFRLLGSWPSGLNPDGGIAKNDSW
jgi:hypothetical protein